MYIAFPTISAYDGCGLMGKVYTSTTLAFSKGAISMVVFSPNGTQEFYSFDFADALCPPASLSTSHSISILGQTGYNPIISPPAGITDIDPTWNQNCRIPAFQGNDPPFALTPASNLSPGPTSVVPVVYPTPASPSSKPSALPIKTDPPKPSTQMFSPQSPSPVVN